MATDDPVAELVERLGLAPHPEGGWFVETWRGPAGPGGRSVGTAIYFLVADGAPSRLHAVDATEVIHWYAGDPVEQLVVDPVGGTAQRHHLGPQVVDGQRPQAVVPPGRWQGLHVPRPGGWCLLGCTVSPGFDFAGFRLADAGDLAALEVAHPDHVDLLRLLGP